MKSFQGKLPHKLYIVKINTGKRFIKFLESYGCYADKNCTLVDDGYVTIWCGNCYDYALGSTTYPDVIHLSAKAFKRLVIETVGEA